MARPDGFSPLLRRINCLQAEISGLYHQASQALGLSDADSMVLYTLYENGGACLLRTVYKETGSPRQTVNSALRRLEGRGLLQLQPYRGRAKQLLLAAATAVSQLIGGGLPLVYFAKKNSSLLRLGKTRFDARAIGKAAANGSSEFMSNVSMSLVGMLYNLQLIAYAGEDGVAAYGVMMYVSMIFSAAFVGYSIGTAPVIAYHDGARNTAELRSLLRKSLCLIGVCSLLMIAAAEWTAGPLGRLFVGYDPELLALTVHGFRIFALAFAFMGFAIFASGFFTALNNGAVSALISFLRTIVFQAGAVLLLPLVWDVDGVWASLVVAEAAAALLSAGFMLAKRRQYQY